MNDLMIFKNEDFGQVRTINIDGKIYFVAFDVAKALGYEKERNAIKQHCPHALKRGVGVQTGTKKDGTPAMQTVEMNIIPEGDVYRLIINSKLPAAQKFERWVFDDLLPQIRITGAYGNYDRLVQELAERSIAAILAEVPVIISQIVNDTMSLKQSNRAKQETLQKKDEELVLLERLVFCPKNKIETFPPAIQNLIDRLLCQMKEEESFNFSMVARMCTLQGYSITSPTIKNYYDKKFK